MQGHEGIMEAMRTPRTARLLRSGVDLNRTMVRIRWPRLRAAVARFISVEKLSEKVILEALAGDELYVKILATAWRKRHDWKRRGGAR